MKETTCKPYQCHCGKLFKKKSSLKAHLSIHSTAIFNCECGCVFRCEQYLKNHQRRKHSDDAKGAAEKRIRLMPGTANEIEMKIEKTNVAMEDNLINPMDMLRLQMQD